MKFKGGYLVSLIVDMMRTATNVTGKLLVPVVVAREEGIPDMSVYDGAIEIGEVEAAPR